MPKTAASSSITARITKLCELQECSTVGNNHAMARHKNGEMVHIKWGEKINTDEVRLMHTAALQRDKLRFQVAQIIGAGFIVGTPFLVTAQIPGQSAVTAHRLVDTKAMTTVAKLFETIGTDYQKLLAATFPQDSLSKPATPIDIAATIARITKWATLAERTQLAARDIAKIIHLMVAMILQERTIVAAAHGDIHAEHIVIPNEQQSDQRPYLTDINLVWRPEGLVSTDLIRSITSLLAHTLAPEDCVKVITRFTDQLAEKPEFNPITLYSVLAFRTLGILLDCTKDVQSGKSDPRDLAKRNAAGRAIIQHAFTKLKSV